MVTLTLIQLRAGYPVGSDNRAISIKNVHGEFTDDAEDGVPTVLSQIMAEYKPNDIHDADKSGL